MKQITMNGEALCRAIATLEGVEVPSAELLDVRWTPSSAVPGEQPPFGMDLNWGGDPAVVRVYPIRVGSGTVEFSCRGVSGDVGFVEDVEIVPETLPDDARAEWGEVVGG